MYMISFFVALIGQKDFISIRTKKCADLFWKNIIDKLFEKIID